jgi:hypothetical protein
MLIRAAVGQSMPKWGVRATSTFPPLATELRTSREVRFVPICDIAHGISHRVASLCAPRSHFLVL